MTKYLKTDMKTDTLALLMWFVLWSNMVVKPTRRRRGLGKGGSHSAGHLGGDQGPDGKYQQNHEKIELLADVDVLFFSV